MEAKKYTEGLTDNFFEYERIARNKPHASIPKEYPKTTDGTTASIIRKSRHRVIQQLPGGKVVSHSDKWLEIIADFIFTNKIIPNANDGYSLIQKCWGIVERFQTYGFAAVLTPFIKSGEYLGPDMRLVYWGDIFLQPGKVSGNDCDYVFIRQWYQTGDIEAIIASQKEIKNVQTTWDISALEKIKDLTSTKEDKSKTASERERNNNDSGGIELITAYQVGQKSKFYTFHLQSTGTGKSQKTNGTIVRTKINKDPRGYLPVDFGYGDSDGTSPFGRSVIELVGPMQNLMDTETQMYQYNRALGLNPPLLKRGNFSKGKIKFAPNVIIDLGTDPNANIEPLKIDTTSLSNFPNNYGLMKSQLINLLSSPDTSISAEVGNPGFSKTPQGVDAMKANLNIDDNYLRKQFETLYERWAETAINIYFAERSGIEELQLDEETANKLKALANEGKFDLNKLSDDNRIRIDYDTETEKLNFQVDASSSKVADEVQQLQSYQGLVELIDKSPFLQGIIPPEKQMELWNAIVANSGAENQDAIRMTPKELEQIMAQKAQQPPVQPREYLPFKDIVSVAPQAAAAMLEQAGLPGDELKARQPESPKEDQIKPELILKADQQAHQQEMDKLDRMQQGGQEAPADPQQTIMELKSLGLQDEQIGRVVAALNSQGA